jgi:hypothetical protein
MWVKLKTVSIWLCLILFLWPDNIMKAEETAPPPVTTVMAVGDIMMGTDYPSPKLPKKDGKLLFEASEEILRKTDIVFGNLEGPLYQGSIPAKKHLCKKDERRGILCF